ncbi:uncharacterized protein LOC109821847 [Asparagus officinalis]|uniref:uncharacterized protein LOC109821847 n=1 Tax=Asparagus officinalis TaxID=4686 RepID=UPI00098E581B|nr:uncharacterized protein LOC109821847 [Asparagus officinalis]
MAPPPTDPPEKVTSESRFCPYFKDCIGAIDGTYIPCMVYGEDQTPYRNRHGYLYQNILAACTFDLRFIYVLVGWERSANDSRVLKDAMSRSACSLPLPNGFPYETQKSMIWACIGLYNFLKMENSNDDFEVSDLPPEAPRNVAPIDGDSDEDDDLQTQQAQRTAASRWRE